MASRNCQGRRLDWSICQSEQVADLADPWAKLLFTWLIPNADNCGRLEGEPYQVAGLVFPLEVEKGTVTVAKVEKWLAELHNKGLIIWYRSGRLRYIQLPKFSTRQTLTGNMKAVSDYPPANPEYLQAWEDREQGVCTSSIQGPDVVCSEAKDKAKANISSDTLTVFRHWQERCGHPGAKLTPDRRGKIVARLREGATAQHLCDAIDGCAASRFHMGDNKDGKRYDSIELIFRNASKTDEFADAGKATEAKSGKARETRVARAVAELQAQGDVDVARSMVRSEDEWQQALREAGL